MKKIVVQDGDDWVRVFIDEKLVTEGHSLHWRDWGEILKHFDVEIEVTFGQFDPYSDRFEVQP